MLSHLVYVSTRTPNCNDGEIQKILSSCIKNNKDIDITGVLLYSETNFVQYIEGDYNQIISLYDKIKGDMRHKNPVLIVSSPIKERSFPSWQMGAKKIDLKNLEFHTDISKEDKVVFNSILSGKSLEGNKALVLLKKFFK